MTTQQAKPKPRLWLRILTVFLILVSVGGALGYLKFNQLQALTAQGNQIPPPISVTVAQARPDTWNRRIRAVGTLVAFQGVDITTEESGIVTAINFKSGEEVESGTLLVDHLSDGFRGRDDASRRACKP